MESPIVVGVTGHRDLREQDVPKLRELVAAELSKLIEQYPNSCPVLLDSLASGADTLCAQIALELGMELVCPLPLPVEEYRRDFSKTDAEVFDALLKRASNVFTAPNTAPMPEKAKRDFYYRQAGIYIAAHSHVLLALWDGQPAKPGGCGTAEVVDFMLSGEYSSLRVSGGGVVVHILTPRQSTDAKICISARLMENGPDSRNTTKEGERSGDG